MRSLPGEDLESALLDKVELRRQLISQTVEEVQKVVHCLTTEISHQDARFQAVPCSDTYHGHIKVLAPRQLLVTVPMRGLAGYREARAQRWRYYSLQGTRLRCPLRAPEGLAQWLELEQFTRPLGLWHGPDVSTEGDLVPAKVLQVFRTLLERAIAACGLAGQASLLEDRTTIWVVVETGSGPVDVELAPTVDVPGTWPGKARWPRCLRRWPPPETVQCVKSFGFSLVAGGSYHWQLSFVQAERALLVQMDEDGGCRRRCLRLLKQLTEDVWCPGPRPLITAQHLETVLLWTCEKHPQPRAWREPGPALLRLVRKLHKCVSQRLLRHYFVPHSNLLQSTRPHELHGVAQKLAFFLKNPDLRLPGGDQPPPT
ncbi:protein mab-21-like 3 isoform X2 [Dipodomys spectabilis]|nr:protein mab-21-like 3 isoform X2 [Dipodomys spectabilis]XP_042548246.1 protein mab-21-like 3 isoform X2 [Dipodomys spectabilis]XP_042548247.1 protein mab-21-like 3 isoform X2 [Dipodomys spectabilis]